VRRHGIVPPIPLADLAATVTEPKA
jgi:hypothetical protein